MKYTILALCVILVGTVLFAGMNLDHKIRETIDFLLPGVTLHGQKWIYIIESDNEIQNIPSGVRVIGYKQLIQFTTSQILYGSVNGTFEVE